MRKKKTSNMKPSTSTKAGFNFKPCHTDPTMVYANLWLGSGSSAIEMVRRGVDVLVPMAELAGSIWDNGFRGRILYYPCRDYYALPQDVLVRAVDEIITALKEGHKVGIFCVGGHGRTGYLASAVLGKLLPDQDPIELVRRIYCSKAVESLDQIESLAEFLGRKDLLKHEPRERWSWVDFYQKSKVLATCKDCGFFDGAMHYCELLEAETSPYRIVCNHYYPLMEGGDK